MKGIVTQLRIERGHQGSAICLICDRRFECDLSWTLTFRIRREAVGYVCRQCVRPDARRRFDEIADVRPREGCER